MPVSTEPHPEAFSGRTSVLVWLAGGFCCWMALLALIAALA